ncbi:MAG: (Fe-S)-binding protein [Candidatus Helarchaeota archaeon]
MFNLDEIRKWVYACINCGSCRYLADVYDDSCPSGVKFQLEPYYGGGKVWLAQYLLEGGGDFTESIIHKLYACPVCGNCAQQCELEISDYIVDIIEGLRAEAVRRGKGPLPEQKSFAESIKAEHNPYKEKHADRLNWAANEIPQKDSAEILYFVGCTSSYRQKELAQKTVKILNKLGVDYMVSKDEWCCGSPLMRTGQLELVNDLIENNINLIKNTGAKTVITSCAGCYKTLKEDYPKFGSKLEGIKILHITQFLNNAIKDGKIKLEKEFNETITYHDPCHLGRHSGVFKEPRKVLKKIPGLNFIEMPRNKENAWCCGAGGGVKSGFKDWAVEIASERIKEAEGTGASILISSCPFCKTNLEDAIKATNSKLKFMDIVNLLAELI